MVNGTNGNGEYFRVVGFTINGGDPHIEFSAELADFEGLKRLMNEHYTQGFRAKMGMGA